MKIYSIDNKTDRIAAHSSAKEAEGLAHIQRFSTEVALAKLAVEWPTSRLVRIWNALPGAIAVRKFTSRKLAIARIWKAVQKLDEPKGEKTCEAPDNALRRKPKTGRGSQTNRTETILALLKQPGGATLEAIMKATGWQSHSVRGFISGTVRGKLNLNVTSERDEKGARTYRVEA